MTTTAEKGSSVGLGGVSSIVDESAAIVSSIMEPTGSKDFNLLEEGSSIAGLDLSEVFLKVKIPPFSSDP